MRLLNIWTFKLGEFFEKEIPRYYILSHRWGDAEVSYKNYTKERNLIGPGCKKIINSCKFARRYNKELWTQVDWLWIDTCCIDKRSSAELSEAINSMFTWYKAAEACFVYLADVVTSGSSANTPFSESSWFTRGWTLQELLAPEVVLFCNASWEILGHKCSSLPDLVCTHEESTHGLRFLDAVSQITKIPTEYIAQFHPSGRSAPSIAQRMSWASRRTTTRTEDEAYCLLGLFGVNIPLIYGEGRKAFLRLQEEIMRSSTDQSIFAWRAPIKVARQGALGMLAPSPSWFVSSGDVVLDPSNTDGRRNVNRPCVDRPYAVTNNGVELKAPLIRAKATTWDGQRIEETDNDPIFMFHLNCLHTRKYTGEDSAKLAFKLQTGHVQRGASVEDKMNALHLVRINADDIGDRFSAKEGMFAVSVTRRIHVPTATELHYH